MLFINEIVGSDSSFVSFLNRNSTEQISSLINDNKLENIDILIKKATAFLLDYGRDNRISDDIKMKAWFLIPQKISEQKSFIPLSVARLNISHTLSQEIYIHLTSNKEDWRIHNTEVWRNIKFSPSFALNMLYSEISKDKLNIKLIELLIYNLNEFTNHLDSNKNNLLHLAITTKNFHVINLLCTRGVNVNQLDVNGNTPLHLAIINECSEEIIKLLIDYRTDLSRLNNQGYAPIHLACLAENKSLIELLFIWGADVSQPGGAGFTPLHLTALSNSATSLEISKLLIDYKADINKKNNSGDTPLHIAVFKSRSNKELIELLIQNGADLYTPNDKGLTPSWFLKKTGWMPSIPESAYDNEYHSRLMLANLWTLSVRTEFQGRTPELEGGRGMVGDAELIRLFDIYCNHLKEIVNVDIRNFLLEKIQELKWGYMEGRKEPNEVLSSFQSGRTLAFSTGWKNHAIEVVFHKNYLMVMNRGRGSRRSSVRLFKINRQMGLPISAINQLQNISNLSAEEGINFYYKTLPNLLGYNEKDTDYLSNHFNLVKRQNKQKIGNCWWVGPKSTLFGYLIIEALLPLENVQFDNLELKKLEYDRRTQLVQEIYKSFTLFSRVQVLKEYLDRPKNEVPRDHQLVKKVIHKMTVENREKWLTAFSNSSLLGYNELDYLLSNYKSNYELDQNFEKKPLSYTQRQAQVLF